jgi:hypothetical protein
VTAAAWIAALSLAVMAACCFDGHRRAYNINPGPAFRRFLARIAAKMAGYR